MTNITAKHTWDNSEQGKLGKDTQKKEGKKVPIMFHTNTKITVFWESRHGWNWKCFTGITHACHASRWFVSSICYHGHWPSPIELYYYCWCNHFFFSCLWLLMSACCHRYCVSLRMLYVTVHTTISSYYVCDSCHLSAVMDTVYH